MSNQSSLPQYSSDSGFGMMLGPFTVLGANQTPFLSYMGGLNNFKIVPGQTFAMDVYSSLESADITGTTEANAAAGTGTTIAYTRAQHTNYIEMFLRNIEVTYMKISDRMKQAGIYYMDPAAVDSIFRQQELDFQTEMNLRQLAVNMEKCCFQGVAVAPSASSTAVATRGLIATGSTDGGIQTNKIAGGSGYLTKDLIDQMVKSMADNGAPFTDPVIFCGSYQKAKISKIYGWSPVAAPGTGVGGVAVEVIETDFARIPVIFAPQMLTTAIACVEMSECKLAGLPVPGKGAIFVEEKGKIGAGWKYQLYAQLGLDYGEESHHGSIVALLAS